MSTKEEVHDLLRFLTQDAKIPLPVAIAKVKELQEASLTNPACLASSDVQSLTGVFTEKKLAKQVLSAAKRVSKKRTASASDPKIRPAAKRAKGMVTDEAPSAALLEKSLALPTSDVEEPALSKVVLHTNRAPLVLAFAVALLKYTMPEQPISSRLSLAQAVVSVNSRSKAASIGLESGPSAEEAGWGYGQPKIRIMGREVRVLKRWSYDAEDDAQETSGSSKLQVQSTQHEEPGGLSLWGLDLEALRGSDKSAPGSDTASARKLPIHTPQSARAYLLKSFATVSVEGSTGPAKTSTAAIAQEKETNLAMLLKALDIVYSSWVLSIGRDELDKRAWGWYVRVRPDVQSGAAGWGGKGEVHLANILELRRNG